MEAVRPASAPATSDSLAHDLSPLTHALGSPTHLAGFTALTELVESHRPTSVSDLQSLLRRFHDRLLLPIELPAIRDAYLHAARGEVRELTALDLSLASHYGNGPFADASRHVGRLQLRRLRPLRDRVLQRYLAAVDQGRAPGMHLVVYGVLLHLFSLPLRQGLLHYAQRTHESLLDSASTELRLTHAQRVSLADFSQHPALPAVQALVQFSPLG